MKKVLAIVAFAMAMSLSACQKEPVTPDKPHMGENCYIVNTLGQPFAFYADSKGHSEEPLAAWSTAEVIWESFGTEVVPSDGDVIRISYDSSAKTISVIGKANGNALVAVKDAEGKILWSWHIWVCDGYDPEATAHTYNNNAGTVMDRNLGATSATPGKVESLGLLYQWGRKDPFLGSSSISETILAKSSGKWDDPESSKSIGSGVKCIEYSILHPTCMIIYNRNNNDWYFSEDGTTDNTRWKEKEKTMYDPCPAGWRVPDGGAEGLWAKAFGTRDRINNIAGDNGFDFGSESGIDATLSSKNASVWYPSAGFIDRTEFRLEGVGDSGHYWTTSPNEGNAYSLYLMTLGMSFIDFADQCSYNNRANGMSVRCIREK